MLAQDRSDIYWGLSNIQEIWLADLTNISENLEPIWLHYTDVAVGYDWTMDNQLGLQIYSSAFFTNGNSISELVGDLQGISNIEASKGAEVLEAWVELKSPLGLRVRGGILDSNADFDSIEPAQFFINSSHGIGPDLSSVGANGPSIFPETGLGGMLLYEAKLWSVKVGSFDPLTRLSGNSFEEGKNYDWDFNDGALWITEFLFNFEQIALGLGMWNSSYSLQREYPMIDNLSNAKGLYGFISQSKPFGNTYLRLGLSESKNAFIDRYIGLGWTNKKSPNTDLLSKSVLGISWASARLGELGLFNEFGMEKGGKISHSYEHILEISALSKLSELVQIQPNLQFVIQPNADRKSGTTLVLGIRGILEL
jgi:porin